MGGELGWAEEALRAGGRKCYNRREGQAMARESGRIPIIVALITVAGGIITAWITTREHRAAPPSEVQAQQAGPPAVWTTPEALNNLSNKQAQTLAAET